MATPVIIRSKNRRIDITENVIDGTLVQGIQAVTELTLNIDDPEWGFLREHAFAIGTQVRYKDEKLRVASLETGNGGGEGGITLMCRPEAVRRLKNRKGSLVMRGVSPSDFVEAECKAVGVPVIAQSSANRKSVNRDIPKDNESEINEPPSSWTTFARLADEVGFYLFESGGTVYFGKPSWLLNHGKPLRVVWKFGSDSEFMPEEFPNCSRSEDRGSPLSINLVLPIERRNEVAVGMNLSLTGVPTFKGHYIVTDVQHPATGNTGNITVTASKPDDPDPTGEAEA